MVMMFIFISNDVALQMSDNIANDAAFVIVIGRQHGDAHNKHGNESKLYQKRLKMSK